MQTLFCAKPGSLWRRLTETAHHARSGGQPCESEKPSSARSSCSPSALPACREQAKKQRGWRGDRSSQGVFQDGQTIDGFDMDFQIHHLNHFLLTHLLLDRLKRCAPSRIIIVSSSAHSYGKIDFQTIHKPAEGPWQAFQSYSNSKLANILHARELTNRLEGTNVTCYAVHPGAVRTEIGYSCRWWLFRMVWFLLVFRRDCDTGAQTIIYCATEKGIESLSGQYFADCQPKVPSPQARDDHMATKLWEFSERLLGLTT